MRLSFSKMASIVYKVVLNSVSAILVVVLSTISMSESTRADEYYPFSQDTCVPELNYFSHQNFGIWNLAEGPYMHLLDVRPDIDNALQKTYGVTGNEQAVHTCEIPATPLEQGWDNARPALHIRMQGGAVVINDHVFIDTPMYTFFSVAPSGPPNVLQIETCAEEDVNHSQMNGHFKVDCQIRQFDMKTGKFWPEQ